MHLSICQIKIQMVLVSHLASYSDLAMLGYLVNTEVGGIIYNIFHFKGTAVAIGLLGLAKDNKKLMLVGIILLAHYTMDRSIGQG
jgi:hypothetical protein